jgi:hypothetical protein
MKVKLVNYNRKICNKGKYRVIIDEVKVVKSAENVEMLKILFGNEVGVLGIDINTTNEIDALANIYTSCNLSIPEDYFVEIDDIKNKLLYLILKEDRLENEVSIEQLEFEVYPKQNSNDMDYDDMDDGVPF